MNNFNQQQDPSIQRNMIIAVILAGIIMFLFEVFYNGPIREEQRLERLRAEEQRLAQELAAPQQQNFGTNAIGDDDFGLSTSRPVQQDYDAPVNISREDLIARSSRVKIDNGRVHGSIRLQGARFDDITLADYDMTTEEDSPEVIVMSPSGSQVAELAELNWASGYSNILAPNSNSVWQVVGSSSTLSATSPITLRWDNGQGFVFYQKISIDENYLLSVEQSIENSSNQNGMFSPYGLVSKSESSDATHPLAFVHTGAVGVIEDSVEKATYDKLRKEGAIKYENAKGWIGLTDKYWLKALIPSNGENFKANFRYKNKNGNEKFQIDYIGEQMQIIPGTTISYKTKLFLGAKELNLLEDYSDKYGILHFDRAVDFGFMYFLANPFTHALSYFYKLLGNFGLAIIALTICVKLALFPLARKSYVSMGRLKNLSPRMNEIREQHKDDKMEMQRKVMEMYKKEKINPASGCVPILLQMPIFFALYRVFMVSLEMRHAPFVGWIQDMSAPDPTSIMNLFGILPFDAPGFLAIGIWPILMGVTMFMQQLLSPAPPDKTQAAIIKFMPVVLVVLFHNLPAGIFIYWTISNTITFLQQLYFTVKMPRKD